MLLRVTWNRWSAVSIPMHRTGTLGPSVMSATHRCWDRDHASYGSCRAALYAILATGRSVPGWNQARRAAPAAFWIEYRYPSDAMSSAASSNRRALALVNATRPFLSTQPSESMSRAGAPNSARLAGPQVDPLDVLVPEHTGGAQPFPDRRKNRRRPATFGAEPSTLAAAAVPGLRRGEVGGVARGGWRRPYVR